MQDWIGSIFFVLLIAGAYFGLRALANRPKRTAEDFERSVSEGPRGAAVFVNALQDAVDPAAARSKVVITQMKDGSFQKKKNDGEAEGVDR